MQTAPSELRCDGCGLPASPEHIAARLERLEFSTRFRPVHISVLFIGLAPESDRHTDFYGSPSLAETSGSLLDAVNIPPVEHVGAGSAGTENPATADAVRLAEFQRRGYFLAYLSECPLPVGAEPTSKTIDRLSSTLLRRIQFNYRPKAIALLSEELTPVIDVLRNAGLGSSLLLNQGAVLSWPRTGDPAASGLFQKVLTGAALQPNRAGGYDRLPLTQTEPNFGAGGSS